jgi:hypothetical protein
MPHTHDRHDAHFSSSKASTISLTVYKICLFLLHIETNRSSGNIDGSLLELSQTTSSYDIELFKPLKQFSVLSVDYSQDLCYLTMTIKMVMINK